MLARLTIIFTRLEDVALYAERKALSVAGGERVTVIQRIDLSGIGNAQGLLLDSHETFNKLNVRMRLDAPLGQSHQWFYPTGHDAQADFHADHFTIIGQGITEMAMRALTDNNLEIWVHNTHSEGVHLERPPVLEAEQIEFDLAYFADNPGFRLSLRRRR